jgi:TRAP transporter TAXI family solute receptor
MIVSFAACGVAAPVEYPKFIAIGGGSTGGLFFSVAAGFAQLFSTKTPIQATAQTTTGGGQNILLMAGGEIEMAIADNQIIQQAFNGVDTFEGKQNKNISAICAVYPTYFQQVVRPGANIKTMDDIKGKRMIVGGPASGTENATRIVYAAHGFDYTDRKDVTPDWLGVAAGQEKMQNQQADGMTSISPYPYSVYTEMTMTGDAKLISLNDDAIAKLCSGNSPYSPGTIPAGTYKNQEEDVKTIVMKTLLIAKGDLSDDLVYELTKLIFENREYLLSQNNAFGYMDINTTTEGLTIPLHPGAERYYKEVGVLK